MKRILTIFCFIMLISACGKNEPETTLRPSNVPASAIYAGGLDGGFYILLTKTSSANIVQSEIYHSSGDLSYKGLLKSNQAVDISDANINGWDGDTLYLKDGTSIATPE